MYDSHTHLQDERFDACREAVIEAARAAGVTGACCCGCSPGDWAAVERLTTSNNQHPTANAQEGTAATAVGAKATIGCSMLDVGCSPGISLLPAFGVHPWYAGNLPADWQAQLEGFLSAHPEAPVGEIGIDGLRDDPPRNVQRQVLEAQLEMAVLLDRPVVLHGARAWGDLLAIIKPFAPHLPGFVAHAFGGSADVLRDVVALGGYVSFAGPVCNPAAKHVRAAAAAAPAERLLIETDAPDMNPRGQRPEVRHQASGVRRQDPVDGIPAEINHPANLVYVAQAAAELRGVPVEEIAAITAANARRVYRIAVSV